MIFTTITDAEIQVNQPVSTTLLTKIKDSFDDLATRYGAAEIQSENSTNTVSEFGGNLIQLCDTSITGFTTNLLTAADATGKYITIKKTSSDSNTLTIDPFGSETIDGSATYTMTQQYDFVTIISDGTNWHILAKLDRSNIVPDTRAVNTNAPLSGGGPLTSDLTLTIGNITNSHISNSAALAYSKINFGGNIVNADINSSAAIAYSKLNLSNSLVNSDFAAASIVLADIDWGTGIVDSDVSSGASINYTKLETLALGKAVITDGSGYITVDTSVTTTEIGYLNGLTSGIQGLLDDKSELYSTDVESTVTAGTSGTFTGHVVCDFSSTTLTSAHVAVTCYALYGGGSNEEVANVFLLICKDASGTYQVSQYDFGGNGSLFGASGSTFTWSVSGTQVLLDCSASWTGTFKTRARLISLNTGM